MKKIKTILLKEWAEVFKNRVVVLTTAFLPLFFAVLPLIILTATQDLGTAGAMDEVPEQMRALCPPGSSPTECIPIFFVSQFNMLFMMLPLIIPVNIAAQSIVGEKTLRSLEPLLATPITTAQLLIGKNLAATVPAVLATWAGFGVFVAGAGFIAHSSEAVEALLAPAWLFGIFAVGPLLAVLSVNFSLLVSSQVNDARVAEQISALVVLPITALFIGQLAGAVLIDRSIILVMGALVALADVGLLLLTVRLFQRETILTRWK